jgi:hypothetical protein
MEAHRMNRSNRPRARAVAISVAAPTQVPTWLGVLAALAAAAVALVAG